MNLLVAFSPWIAFAVASRVADWRVGLIAGVVAQVAVNLTSRRRVGILNAGMLVFFAVVGAVALARPDSPIKDHIGNLSMGWLAIVALLSIAAGHPFTLDFSTDGVPAEVARSVPFRAVNRTITAVWAACFAGIALTGAVGNLIGRPGLATAATVVLLVAAIKFTQQYPDRAAARADRDTGRAGAAEHRYS